MRCVKQSLGDNRPATVEPCRSQVNRVRQQSEMEQAATVDGVQQQSATEQAAAVNGVQQQSALGQAAIVKGGNVRGG